MDGTSSCRGCQRSGSHRERASEWPQGRRRPTIVIVDSHIGYVHRIVRYQCRAGEPLGEDEIKLVKAGLRWPPDAKFLSSGYTNISIRDRTAGPRKRANSGEKRFADYRKQFPELAAELDQIPKTRAAWEWSEGLPVFPADSKGVSDATPLPKSSMPLRRIFPGSSEIGRPHSVHQDATYFSERG